MSEHGVCLLTGVTCTDEAGLEVAIFKLYTHDCKKEFCRMAGKRLVKCIAIGILT